MFGVLIRVNVPNIPAQINRVVGQAFAEEDSNVEVDLNGKTLKVSEIFKWYIRYKITTLIKKPSQL